MRVHAQDGLIHKDEFALALFKLQVCNKLSKPLVAPSLRWDIYSILCCWSWELPSDSLHCQETA